MRQFSCDDKVQIISPHTDIITIGNFRGYAPDNRAVIWTGLSQVTVPISWLKMDKN